MIFQKLDYKYFLSWVPGTQGRFLDLVMKSIIYNDFKDFTQCSADFNSWHNDDIYTKNTHFLDTFNGRVIPDHLYFQKITFPKPYYSKHISNKIVSVTSIRTHKNFDWQILSQRKNLDDVKFIIIQHNDQDLLEIYANWIYKNIIQNIIKKDKEIFQIEGEHLIILFNIFQNLYGTCSFEKFIEEITTNFDKTQVLIKIAYSRNIWIQSSIFFKNGIDPMFKDRTLIINYRDMFSKINYSYPVLDKISNFFKINYNNNAVEMCDYNSKNRLDFIKNYMYNLDIRI